MAALAERKLIYPLFLSVLFIAAFTVPVFFFLNLNSREEEESPDVHDESGIPVTLAVPDANNFISVASSDALSPSADSEFLFWVWFRLKKLPEEGEAVVFVAKIDATERSNSGYTIGITREGDRILPIVYWRDESGVGESHTFADMSIFPRDWTMLALSFTGGKYLSLHGYSLNAGSADGEIPSQSDDVAPELLGAYELDPVVVPFSTKPLVLGALSNGRFRGKIGPFGMLKTEDLRQKLPSVLKHLITHHSESPLAADSAALSLLVVNGEEDLSSYHHEVKNRSARVRRRKKDNGNNHQNQEENAED